MRVLLLTDKKNWAYHSIAKALLKYNHRNDMLLKVMHVKTDVEKIKRKHSGYDKILVMGWQTYEKVNFLPKHKTLVGIHSFHSWDEKKTTPHHSPSPPKKLVRFLNSFRGVNVVSNRLLQVFNKSGLNVVYTPNGVDTSIFVRYKIPPVGGTLVVGYSGSKAHDWRKGVSKFIIPAAKKAQVELKITMLSTNSYLPLEDMYKFYNEIDCYVCASSSEGMSLSVLEAAACGRPIIGTRISGNEEIIKDGNTGFFVQQDVNEISDRVSSLKDKDVLRKMSDSVLQDTKDNWCWSKRAKKWIDFLYES